MRILGFRLVTRDAGALCRFYEALGFARGDPRPIARAEMAMLGLAGAGERTPLRLGDQWIELDAYEQAGRRYPVNARAADPVFQHFALVTDDIDAMWRRAREAGAAPISRDGPVTLPSRSGGVTAVKFRDPEGHPLEFLRFPDPDHPWRGRGLQGIDHSAIVVTDAPRSRRFYEDQGLSAADGTLNRGAEQDRLDGLDEVCVRVQPMTPADGPAHLELLGYEHPPGVARDAPAVNDVAATRTAWIADRSGLLRDPDGHLHQLSG